MEDRIEDPAAAAALLRSFGVSEETITRAVDRINRRNAELRTDLQILGDIVVKQGDVAGNQSQTH
jgi:hypothetical protein